MKFYLVKNANAVIVGSGRDRWRNVEYRSTTLTAEIKPIDEGSSTDMEKCTRLKGLLDNDKLIGDGESLSSRYCWFWNFGLGIGVSEEALRGGDRRTDSDGYLNLTSTDVFNCLTKLVELFEGVKIQVGLSRRPSFLSTCQAIFTISSQEMVFRRNTRNQDGTLFQDNDMKFPPSFCEFWSGPSSGGCVQVTVTVTVPDAALLECHNGTLVPLTRGILEGEVLSDVTILCGDGTEIKAHRNFLAARSSVFLAMFQTDMKESRNSVLELPDMEAKSVRAFLKYLYYSDTKDAEGDFAVVFELFQAAHKYDVKCLEGKMREMILNLRKDQIDLSGAAKLFMFAGNMTPGEEVLRKKAASVLKLYSANLKESSVMQELFQTNYMAALELLQYAYELTN